MTQRKLAPELTSDAGAFAAAEMGEQAKLDDAAFATGSPIYERAESVIADNQSGGAGYFAEAHHTASLNIDANRQHANISAERLGSTAFGSPDVVLSNGAQFNPKFYSTAELSYHAGSELVDTGDGLVAKYAGQTILVPSDQLQRTVELHAEAIGCATAEGDSAKVDALRSIEYDDHIHQDGVESLPLSYADAQKGADGIRHGVLPDYVGEELDLIGTASEGAVLAASITIAASVGPQLLADAANVMRGTISRQEAIARLQTSLGDARTRASMGWAATRGSSAAAVVAIDAIDPTGAALLVNVLIDVIQISQRLKKGQIGPAEFPALVWAATKDRSVYTALAAGSFWVMGPIGLLVPVVVRLMVRDAALRRQTVDAWNSTTEVMQAELASRFNQTALLDDIRRHYRNANAAADANRSSLAVSASQLVAAGRLLGYAYLPPSQPGNGAAA